MATKFEKPAWQVTVGSSYFCPIVSKTRDTITYDTDVLEVPIIKTLGLAPTQSEVKFFASGIMYDMLSQTSGAEITLNAVALPQELLADLQGATQVDGFTFSKSNDINKEFAFGYWAQLSNGEYFYYWHPVCKLVPDEENFETRGEDIPEPEKSYRIIIVPFNDVWKVKYSTEKATTPLTKDEFFAKPIYSETAIPTPAVKPTTY